MRVMMVCVSVCMPTVLVPVCSCVTNVKKISITVLVPRVIIQDCHLLFSDPTQIIRVSILVINELQVPNS